MARTTLILEQACLDSVREISALERKPMSQVVGEMLSEGILRRKNLPVTRLDFPSFSMGLPTVNVADRNELQDRMES